MKIISLNIGQPRIVEYNGEPIATGIYKTPVAEKVSVGRLTIAGDAQVDKRFHGGASKAVYAYPSEHYEFWRNELPGADLPFGVFGENLTTAGILEDEIFIGDKLRVGTTEFIVTEPRFPCFKLGVRFGRTDVIRKFKKARRSGFYLAVAKTGEMMVGDQIEFIERDENRVSITDLLRLHDEKTDFALAERALKVSALPDKWKRDLRKRIK